MEEEKSIADIKKLNTSICDWSFTEGLQEIIGELESVYDNYSLHSMNDGIIRLYGEKKMLGEIIEYLKRCL